jgi:hypothetical protein
VKKHSSFLEQRESGKEAQSARRDSREVMAELVAQLTKQLEVESVEAPGEDKNVPDGESPNLDRLTVGVDLGDQWSNYCIVGWPGWGEWIRNRCMRFSVAVRKCGRICWCFAPVMPW